MIRGVHTFREGLVKTTPATSAKPRLASASEDVPGDSRPFSLFFPTLGSSTFRIGLDGSGAAGSLLGWGVKAAGGCGLVKALFESADVGVFFATGVAAEGAGLCELGEVFWKKPMMDLWVFPVPCEPEGGCLF
jgi:hypothetical protein